MKAQAARVRTEGAGFAAKTSQTKGNYFLPQFNGESLSVFAFPTHAAPAINSHVSTPTLPYSASKPSQRKTQIRGAKYNASVELVQRSF